MMKTNLLLVIVAGMSLSACAHEPSTRAIRSQCRLEMEAARTAVQLREQGKTKQDMLQTLPPLYPDSTRLLRQMYQNIDDTYTYPKLNDTVYGIYRFEYCVRQLQHKPVPKQIQEVSSQLLVCQTQFDQQASKQIVKCIREIFTNVPTSMTSTEK